LHWQTGHNPPQPRVTAHGHAAKASPVNVVSLSKPDVLVGRGCTNAIARAWTAACAHEKRDAQAL